MHAIFFVVAAAHVYVQVVPGVHVVVPAARAVHVVAAVLVFDYFTEAHDDPSPVTFPYE